MDLIVSNPPYVAFQDESGLQREVRDYEPHIALFSGPTGFEIYERLAVDARRVLRPGGWIVLELGFASHDRVAGDVRRRVVRHARDARPGRHTARAGGATATISQSP